MFLKEKIICKHTLKYWDQIQGFIAPKIHIHLELLHRLAKEIVVVHFTKQSTKNKLHAAQGYHKSAGEPQSEQKLLKNAACQDEPGLLFFARALKPKF